MELDVDNFQSTYNIEEMKKMNREYKRKNRKKDPSFTGELKRTLKAAHACIDRFSRLQKKLKDIRELIQHLECGCMNCHRRDPQGEDSDAAPYRLTFRRHAQNLLIKRVWFKFFQWMMHQRKW